MSGIKALTSLLGGGQIPKPVRGYLIPLDPNEMDYPLVDEARAFQYFPETIHDVRHINYQNRDIPGLSHPLYSWTSGGSREISFTAIFSRDDATTLQDRDLIPNIPGTGLSINQRYKEDEFNVDIPSAVAWLRSFMYPEVSANGSAVNARPLPPRKLILGMPGLRFGGSSGNIPVHEMVCFMRTCDVNYEAFFSNGTPRIAKVSLLFVETTQYNNRVSIHDAKSLRDRYIAGYNKTDTNEASMGTTVGIARSKAFGTR